MNLLKLLIYNLCLYFINCLDEKLCHIIERLNNKTDIYCKVEYGSYVKIQKDNKNLEYLLSETKPSNNRDVLKIMEYNIDKSGYGGDSPYEKGAQEIIERIYNYTKKEDIDIIVLIEVARDCILFGNYINTAKQLAEKLDFDFVFNPEFYIPDQSNENSQCLIGNVILSKFKIKKYESLIFDSQCCNYENQIGKRNAISIEIEINNKNYKIYGTHLESGQSSFRSFFESMIIRDKQLNEISKNILLETKNSEKNFEEYFIIGDFNNPIPLMKSPFNPFNKLKRFFDSHGSIWFFNRRSCPFDKILDKFFLANLDYIYSFNKNKFYDSKILNEEYFYGFSDHSPIVTNYRLK